MPGLTTCYAYSGIPGSFPMVWHMRHPRDRLGPARQKGAMGYVLAWLLGVPIPILIIVALLRGCA